MRKTLGIGLMLGWQDIRQSYRRSVFGQLDKRKVEIPTPSRSVGEYLATVRLHGDLVATIKLKVVAKK